MSVAVKKLEGVESVKVSLEEGVAEIRLKPGNTLSVERIREIVRDNGFTPKGAELTITGTLVERNGSRALSVTGPDLVYLLVEPPDAKGKLAELQNVEAGKSVLVKGHLPETAPEQTQEPRQLHVLDFTVEAD